MISNCDRLIIKYPLMQRMGTYACDPRMHYQEWNFIKFARSVRRERFRKKKQGGEKKGRKRKSATGFNYRRVSLALTVIRGGDIIPGGISLKRAHPARNVS